MNRAILQQALDALIDSVDDSRDALDLHIAEWGDCWRPNRIAAMRKAIANGDAAIAALQAELAKPEPKPVAWFRKDHLGRIHVQSAQTTAPIEPASQTRNCSRHPDAPHGFDRNGSHAAGRHVCTCENWAPGEAS